MAVADYSTTPASNTAISGINIAEGCAPANINNAFRQMMADVRTVLGTTTALSSSYQPLDADLTAIAALTSAANKVPYATGAGTWALADFTAAGRALMDDASADAQLTTLGGTTTGKAAFVAADAAALRTAAGATTAGSDMFTAASVAAQRTLLGFAATLSDPGTVTIAGGLIVKFGSGTTPGGGSQNITFGTAFPTAFLAGYVTANTATARIGTVTSGSTSGMTVNLFTDAGGAAANNYYWMAIGS